MGRHRATHLHFIPGKRVFVKLDDGECFVDKFVETKSKAVILEERGKIPNSRICSMTIYKDKGSQRHEQHKNR